MILEIKSINLIRNKKLLFKDLNLKLLKSQILILKGSNGIGKSSLLEMIVGIIEEEKGEICFNGLNLGKHKKLFNSNFLYIGHSNFLKEELTVIENLMIWTKICGIKIEKKEIINKLNYFKIKNLSHQTISNLSLGQKRKVALSKLLISDAKIWILDEPTNSLDYKSVNQFKNLMYEHQKKNGSAIITTHIDLKLKSFLVMNLDKLNANKIKKDPEKWENL